MNITNKNISSLIKTYADKVVADKAEKKSAKSPELAGGGHKGDEVRLSEFSRDVQKVQEGLAKIQDVRAEKVAELKAQISEGKYAVSGQDIAEKMIERIIELTG